MAATTGDTRFEVLSLPLERRQLIPSQFVELGPIFGTLLANHQHRR